MSKVNYQNIILAGLLHDIGKFAERGKFKCKQDFSLKMGEEFKYSHAFYTYKYLEGLDIKDSDADDLKYLASRHHAAETVKEFIIAKADRLAAGHERAEKDEDIQKGKWGKTKTPLYPITERVALKQVDGTYKEKIEDIRSFFSLSKITELKNLFPKSRTEFNVEEYEKSYIGFFQEFDTEFKRFLDQVNKNDLIFKHIETLKTILKKYLWCVPQDTQYHTHPDVSLYDHSKLTALLSGCLYKYHEHHNSFNIADIDNDSEEKFLFLSGDISGIQNFIYNINAKGAYKALKGRSFFIQLLPLIISKRILAKLNLEEIHTLYAAGGSFYLILPNIVDYHKVIEEEIEQINYELLKEFDGQIFLRHGKKKFPAHYLANSTEKKGDTENFCKLWADTQAELIQTDRKKYSKIARHKFTEIFGPQSDIKQEKELKESEREKIFINLGRELKTSNKLILTTAKTAGNYPKILGYNFSLIEKKSEPEQALNGTCYYLDGNFEFDNELKLFGYDLQNLPIGGLKGFGEHTFDEIAKMAKGTHKLGILRMDVDNLGKIFSTGLRNYRHEKNYQRDDFGNKHLMKFFNFYSIGRVSTLSTHLSLFFSSVLASILENKDYRDKAVIVYSGGDDLFILGAWDLIPEIAIKINSEFHRFTRDNPAFSLSGGIALSSGKYPIYRSAATAGEAEESAKNYERQLSEEIRVKDSINFMQQNFDWDEFTSWNGFITDISSQEMAKPLISRIKQYATAYEASVKELENWFPNLESKELRKMAETGRWQWLMAYSLKRLENKESLIKKVKDKLSKQEYGRHNIQSSAVVAKWLRDLNRKMEE